MILSERIALITGGSRGIGKAIVKALGDKGATVIATATTESGAQAITQYLKEQGIKGTGLVLNVMDKQSIEVTFNHILEVYGSPDILVNNAAVTRDNLMLRMSEEQWSDVIETNLTAIYRLSKLCLKGMMKKRWGRIINISSVSAFMGNPGQANYAAAKAGMIGFSKSLAAEVASRNITVNSVAPGFVATDMTAVLPEETKNELLKMIPMGRMAESEDIAQVVSFLAAEGGYITGETIHVNGGMYMH
jgi:3-oxoacyl-[acyl-carrier protein] reductase